MIKETIIITVVTVLFTAAIGSIFVKTVFDMLDMLVNSQDKPSDHSGNPRKSSL